MTRLELLNALAPAVRAAGRLIEQVRVGGFVATAKADASPVTEADRRAEALLEAALAEVDPGAQVIGEEACADGGVPVPMRRFWLLDPLDGTRSFVDGGEDYSVNVGLVEDGVAVLGLLLSPRSGVLWTGALGVGAWREDGDGRRAIATRACPPAPVTVTSRSHRDRKTDAWIARVGGGGAVLPSGSSLKFCLLAEGSADVYPRFSPTSEWDTAAGHAILGAAGGAVHGEDGRPLAYGKPGCRNGGFLAVGDPGAFGRLPTLDGR